MRKKSIIFVILFLAIFIGMHFISATPKVVIVSRKSDGI